MKLRSNRPLGESSGSLCLLWWKTNMPQRLGGVGTLFDPPKRPARRSPSPIPGPAGDISPGFLGFRDCGEPTFPHFLPNSCPRCTYGARLFRSPRGPARSVCTAGGGLCQIFAKMRKAGFRILAKMWPRKGPESDLESVVSDVWVKLLGSRRDRAPVPR